tara:strand:+ start:13551 stop:13757 length:207 start_codon:yes stop_codon:yes gene_type:complete
MDIKKAEALAQNLHGLACKECTKGWLTKHNGLTDPIEDIKNCGAMGLISPQLQERLVNEVKEIRKVLN